VFEHAINPETGQEVFVRLSDERAIAVVQEGPRRFQPGQRVLVVRDVNGTRIEGV
jgi:outer membrane lipoprotein SlyB